MRNKRVSIFLFFLGLILVSLPAFSQRDVVQPPHTQGTWKDTVKVNPGRGVIFYDSGGPLIDSATSPGNYMNYQDQTVTFCPDAAEGAMLKFKFNDFRLAQGDGHCDSLFFYNGPSVDSPPLTVGHFNFLTQIDNFPPLDSTIYINNESGCFTVRFASDGSQISRGWEIEIDVRLPCQKVDISLTDSFYVSKGGGPLVAEPYKYHVNNDTTNTRYIDICLGDSIVVEAEFFPQDSVFYQQSIDSLYGIWDHGDRINDTRGYGVLSAGVRYKEMKAYTLSYSAYDQNGCEPDSAYFAKVRIARNPIREIIPLPDICTKEEGSLKVGYQGVGDIVMNELIGTSHAQKKYEKNTFIPDGGQTTGICYETPVQFVEFGNARIESPEDICAICIKAEHSALGDLKIYLKCPEGFTASLKEMVWNLSGQGGAGFSQHRYMLGIPYGGSVNPSQFDDRDVTNPDKNLMGIPWQYCWSVNENYKGKDYRGVMDTFDLQFSYREPLVEYPGYEPIPERVLKPSNYEEHSGFFQPSGDFQSLIGCSLNGEWSLIICDTAELDNGWISEWSMDLCSSKFQPWSYQVNVANVVWEGDGLTPIDNVTASIYHTDIASSSFENVVYGVSITDDLGCTWDTVAAQVVVKTPDVNLGGDTTLCNVVSVKLDAGNNPLYTYKWGPNGEETSSINTDINLTEDQYYVVNVTNSRIDTILQKAKYCTARDSFLVHLGSRPEPDYWVDKLLEGCEPFDVYFKNLSQNSVSYLWDFGDGQTSTEESPKHEYKAGEHFFIFYATSGDGCVDSLSSKVYVYSKPKPDFYWDPMYPTLKQPVVHFINKTTPENDENIYMWKVQVDKSNPNSLKYIIDSTDLTFQWNSSVDNLAQGIYNVELRASTKNMSPRGNVYDCADSISYDIRIINDFLQFPNVVTPNGDGINDVFKITSLVEGMAFPKNELAIYTRSGRRIFYKKDIKVESDFWNPKDTNTPPGTYIYRFVGKGYDQDVEYTGTIEVLTK